MKVDTMNDITHFAFGIRKKHITKSVSGPYLSLPEKTFIIWLNCQDSGDVKGVILTVDTIPAMVNKYGYNSMNVCQIIFGRK